jgi:triosephosphate isomerase
MYLSLAESVALAKALAPRAATLVKTELWVAPSFPFLKAVRDAATEVTFRIGAQNVHWEASGAFTGEVSLQMVKDCGGSFVIVGHSERRSECLETDEMIAKRAAFALAHRTRTILCIGETQRERDGGKTADVLLRQLTPALERITPEMLPELVVAYEPVWAIGTGRYPENTEIDAAHSSIARAFQGRFGQSPPILYGGSVTPENYGKILELKSVQGALVGRASLKAEQFLALARISEETI